MSKGCPSNKKSVGQTHFVHNKKTLIMAQRKGPTPLTGEKTGANGIDNNMK